MRWTAQVQEGDHALKVFESEKALSKPTGGA